MRLIISIIVVAAILYGAYAYLNRDKGENTAHQAYCEELRKELANGEYLGEGEFSFSYGDRVHLIWKGCL
jgi:hypothetical protein